MEDKLSSNFSVERLGIYCFYEMFLDMVGVVQFKTRDFNCEKCCTPFWLRRTNEKWCAMLLWRYVL